MEVEEVRQRVSKARFMSRLCMGLAVASCVFSVVLVMTMYQMGSRLTVVPQLFTTIGGSDTMVYSDALDRNVLNMRSLEWAFVQRFIEEKTFQIPDGKEMFRRWYPVSMLGSMAYAGKETFLPVYKSSDDRIKDVAMKPTLHAENIRYISVNDHVWTVLFDECEQRASGPVCRTKQATVTVRMNRRRASLYSGPRQYLNPFGFVVARYSVQNISI